MHDELVTQLRDAAKISEALAVLLPHSEGNATAKLYNKAADVIEELNGFVQEAERDRDEYRERLDKSNDAIEELMRRCEQLAWTPVTEGLPVERINPYTRDFEFVLCRTIWGDVRPFKYGTPIGQKKAHFWNGAGYVDAYVTHWMQLPTPPKEET